ncbi:FG-GAP repeat domain-containing protein [Streptomyces sp. NPDC003703]|uniref:FG-GAP repeat domain-containing protein n=1 Tax=Streptomyces sp. NPDC003283 TaxID=3364681 RepID=UPI0036C9C1FF
MSAGSHLLYARSIDRGNNASDRTAYLFYVKSPNVTDKPGDLNGDGNSDLYGVRTDGTLRQYSGTGNGTVSVYASASSTNFKGASITHRGDWTGDGYEDLIALTGSAGSRTLQLYPNNGYGYACTTKGEQADSGTCTDDRQELTVDDPADNHWQNADQVLAIGDVDHDGNVDILAREKSTGALYFYPTAVGTSGWDAFQALS